MRQLWPLFALVAAGCDLAAIDLTVTIPDSFQDRVALQVAVHAPSSVQEFGCEEIDYADIAAETLQASQVMSATLDEAQGELPSVPREGRKIVVVRGFDDEGRELLRGCGDAGDVRERLSLEVSLAPTVVLQASATEHLYAAAGATQASPPLELETRTVDGQPLSAAVRLRLYGADAALVDTLHVEDPSAAGEGIQVTPPLTGPFAVEARPHNAVDPLPPWHSGFREPDHSAVDVFGESASAATLHLVPLEENGVAFAALEPGEVRFAIFDPTAAGGFRRTQATLEDVQHDYLGQVFDPSSGRVAAVLFQRRVDAAHQLLVLDVTAPEPPHTNARFRPIDLLAHQGTTAIPLGSCDLHEQAPPLLVTARKPQQSSAMVLELGMEQIQNSAVGNLGSEEPLYSRCVSAAGDGNGEPRRRLLVSRDVHEGELGLWIYDLGSGLTAGGSWDDVSSAPRQFVVAAERVVTRREPDGRVNPFILFDRGLDSALHRAALYPDRSPAPVEIGSLVHTLPRKPEVMHLGPVLSAQSDLVALLSSSATAEEQIAERDLSPGLLLIATGVLDAGRVVMGGMRLPSCSGVRVCHLAAIDLDTDGRQELIVVRAPAYPARVAAHPRIHIIHVGDT